MQHLLNMRWMREIIDNDDYSSTHNTHEHEPVTLGYGIMYYALAYALRARVAVCLGSAHGFVPKLMRQAQRDLGPEFAANSVTVLIDGGYFGNDYFDGETWFTRNFPEVVRIRKTTHEAAEIFRSTGMSIDLLHIDADHEYFSDEGKSGSKHDVETYSEFMSRVAMITMHDGVLYPVWWSIKDLKKSPQFEICNVPPALGSLALVRRIPDDETVWNVGWDERDRGSLPEYDPEQLKAFREELERWRQ